MGALLVFEMAWLTAWLQPKTQLTTQVMAILILVGSAMVVYFALALITGAADRKLLMAALKRKRGKA